LLEALEEVLLLVAVGVLVVFVRLLEQMVAENLLNLQ
jgi:hypothetical protein